MRHERALALEDPWRGAKERLNDAVLDLERSVQKRVNALIQEDQPDRAAKLAALSPVLSKLQHIRALYISSSGEGIGIPDLRSSSPLLLRKGGQL